MTSVTCVFQMLSDYQFWPGGGSGLMRLVQFSPEQDSLSVKTFSPYLNSSVQDSDNQFTYTNLGIFASVTPGYMVDLTRASATLTIANDG